MSIIVGWIDDTRTVLRIAPDGNWVWADVHDAVLRCMDMMHAVNHSVDLVIDLDENNRLPQGNPLPEFSRAWMMLNTSFTSGCIVITNVGTLGRSLANLFMRIYASQRPGGRILFVASYADALKRLDVTR